MTAARTSKLKSYFKSGKKGLEPSICGTKIVIPRYHTCDHQYPIVSAKVQTIFDFYDALRLFGQSDRQFAKMQKG